MPQFLTEQQRRDIVAKFGYNPDEYDYVQFDGSPFPEPPPQQEVPSIEPPMSFGDALTTSLKDNAISGAAAALGTVAASSQLAHFFPGAGTAVAIGVPLITGFGTAISARLAQDAIRRKLQTAEVAAAYEAKIKKAREDQFAASLIGEIAPSFIAGGPIWGKELGNLGKYISRLPRRIIGKTGETIPQAEFNAALGSAVATGVGAGTETYAQYRNKEPINLGRIAGAAVGNFAMSGRLWNNRLNRKLGVRFDEPTATPLTGQRQAPETDIDVALSQAPDITPLSRAQITRNTALGVSPETLPANLQAQIAKQLRIPIDQPIRTTSAKGKEVKGVRQIDPTTGQPLRRYTEADLFKANEITRQNAGINRQEEAEIEARQQAASEIEQTNYEKKLQKIRAEVDEANKRNQQTLADYETSKKAPIQKQNVLDWRLRNLHNTINNARLTGSEQRPPIKAIETEPPPLLKPESLSSAEQIEADIDKSLYGTRYQEPKEKPYNELTPEEAIEYRRRLAIQRGVIKVHENGEVTGYFKADANGNPIRDNRGHYIPDSNGIPIRMAGVTYVSDRVIVIDAEYYNPDTWPHELGELFLNDLSQSTRLQDTDLYNKGLKLADGDRETLAEGVGLRAHELEKSRIRKEHTEQFKQWLQDFWSAVKNRWGGAKTNDIQALLARRLHDDAPYNETFGRQKMYSNLAKAIEQASVAFKQPGKAWNNILTSWASKGWIIGKDGVKRKVNRAEIRDTKLAEILNSDKLFTKTDIIKAIQDAESGQMIHEASSEIFGTYHTGNWFGNPKDTLVLTDKGIKVWSDDDSTHYGKANPNVDITEINRKIKQLEAESKVIIAAKNRLELHSRNIDNLPFDSPEVQEILALRNTYIEKLNKIGDELQKLRNESNIQQDPEKSKTIAWAELATVKDAITGEDILVATELQSNRHQTGREELYNDPEEIAKKTAAYKQQVADWEEIQKLRTEAVELQAEHDKFNSKLNVLYNKYQKALEDLRRGGETEELFKIYNEAFQKYEQMHTQSNDIFDKYYTISEAAAEKSDAYKEKYDTYNVDTKPRPESRILSIDEIDKDWKKTKVLFDEHQKLQGILSHTSENSPEYEKAKINKNIAYEKYRDATNKFFHDYDYSFVSDSNPAEPISAEKVKEWEEINEALSDYTTFNAHSDPTISFVMVNITRQTNLDIINFIKKHGNISVFDIKNILKQNDSSTAYNYLNRAIKENDSELNNKVSEEFTSLIKKEIKLNDLRNTYVNKYGHFDAYRPASLVDKLKENLVPMAPYRETEEWFKRMLKGMIDYAVRKGYKKVGWVNSSHAQNIQDSYDEGKYEKPYDVIYPKAVNAYLKEMGWNQQVKNTEIQHQNNPASRIEADTIFESDIVHTIEITPEIHQQIKNKGQAYFQEPKNNYAVRKLQKELAIFTRDLIKSRVLYPDTVAVKDLVDEGVELLGIYHPIQGQAVSIENSPTTAFHENLHKIHHQLSDDFRALIKYRIEHDNTGFIKYAVDTLTDEYKRNYQLTLYPVQQKNLADFDQFDTKGKVSVIFDALDEILAYGIDNDTVNSKQLKNIVTGFYGPEMLKIFTRANISPRDYPRYNPDQNAYYQESKTFKYGMPGFTGVVDKIAKTYGKAGEFLAGDIFEPMLINRRELIGKYRNAAIDLIKPFNKAERNRINQYGQEMYKNGKSTIQLTPAEENAYNNLRQLLVSAAQQQQVEGPLVREYDQNGKITFRKRGIDKNYWMISMPKLSVIQTLREKPYSSAAQQLREDYVNYFINDPRFNGNRQAVLAELQKNLDMFPKEGSARFIGIRLAKGKGIPPSWREDRLDRLFERYFVNFADDMAYYKHVESNPHARSLLKVTDQFGKHSDVKDKLPDGVTPIYNLSGSPQVEAVMRFIKGAYTGQDITLDSVNRLVRAGMLQTVTGIGDLLTSPGLALSQIPLRDFHEFFRGAFYVPTGVKIGKEQGIISSRSVAALESGMDTMAANTIHEVMNNVSDTFNRYTGRELLENISRGILTSGGKFVALAEIPRAIKGDKKAIKFFEINGPKDWKTLLQKGDFKTLSDKTGARIAELTQQSYDVRDLPTWALEGKLSPFFAIAKWNIGRANNFAKYIINPAMKGDFAPAIKAILGGFLSATALNEVRQYLFKRKPSAPEWKELIEAGPSAGWDDWAYKMATLSSYAGFAGIVGDMARIGFDISHRVKPQGYNMQLADLVGNTFDIIQNATIAIQDGDNPYDVLYNTLKELAESNIQVVKLYTASTRNEAEQQHVKAQNYRRDLRTFEYLHDYPYDKLSGTIGNRVGGSKIKEFKRTPDLQKAAQLLQQDIIPSEIARWRNKPEVLMRRLRSLKQNSYQTFPNIEERPIEALEYASFVKRVRGQKNLQDMLQDYLKQNALNKAKSSFVPVK